MLHFMPLFCGLYMRGVVYEFISENDSEIKNESQVIPINDDQIICMVILIVLEIHTHSTSNNIIMVCL